MSIVDAVLGGMLVLSRQKNERTIITVPPSSESTRIEMTIVKVRGEKVRCGWRAPQHVSVHRSEVQEAIDRDAQHEAGEGAG